jgi:DNA invertase Pin-like site-specific DNA recombinase
VKVSARTESVVAESRATIDPVRRTDVEEKTCLEAVVTGRLIAGDREFVLHERKPAAHRLVTTGARSAAASSEAPGLDQIPVVGYTSGSDPTRTHDREITEQAATIMRECRRRGLNLLEVVRDREPANGKGLGRPGLAYALERIAAGQAQGLVVAELSRITWSAAELGEVIDWLARSNARLVAAAHALDTEDEDGRLAAQVLREVSRWERARLSERTRNGLEAARRSGRSTGRPAVTDDPDLSERIARMRAQGMTLQAIADRLNEEGVPTVRGGARWRHSSVQVAAGYRRRRDRVARGQPIL